MSTGGNFTCGSGSGVTCEPITSVGTCLADGTPIMQVASRDCDTGVVTHVGWVNLTTGAWTDGAVPPGVRACGSPQSIQVSGVFCDVDAAGEVVGIVLVEYEYAADGSIASVRLVDAVTGQTYVPQGEITVCPAGVETPEQDLLQLCEVAADGTITAFLRDYRRDETGTIVGHTDYDLDHQPYTPTGTVTICELALVGEDESPGVEPCLHCETLPLCDVQRGVPAQIAAFGQPTEQWNTLTNGVRWMRSGGDPVLPDGWFIIGEAPTAQRISFDRPVYVTYAVRFSGPTASPLVVPEGWFLDSLSVQHTWDAATRTMTPNGSAVLTGESTFTAGIGEGADALVSAMVAPHLPGPQTAGQRTEYGEVTVTADVITPFLRQVCHDCQGVPVGAPVDRELDNATPYVVQGEVTSCDALPPSSETPAPEPCAAVAVAVVPMCDLNPNVPPDPEGRRCATPFLRHFTYDCTGTVTTRDTDLAGADYQAVQPVDCSSGVPSLQELVWPQTGVTGNNDGGTEFDFTLTNPLTGDTANIHFTTATPAGPQGQPSPPACGASPPGVPPSVNAPAGGGVEASRFTYQLDAVAQQMTRFGLQFIDLDTFEGVRGLLPLPDSVEFTVGAGTYDGAGRIDATQDDSTAVAYWNNPPASITHVYRNMGGGFACHSPTFEGVTLVPGSCCDPCGTGGGEVSPGEECQHCQTLLLCDPAPANPTFIDVPILSGDEGLANPDWCFDSILLDSATPGDLVSPDIWTVGAPVYVRMGLGGISAGESVDLTPGFVVESLHPNHAVNGSTVTGSGSPGDVSIIRYDTPVSEFRMTPGANGHVTDVLQFSCTQAWRADVAFLRTICRDCDGGNVTVEDTELFDATTPYAASADAGPCAVSQSADPEPCRNTSTQLLCDLPTDGEPDQVVTDTDPTSYEPRADGAPVAGGAAALWSGGALTIPPDTAALPDSPVDQMVRLFGATVQADRPACDTGMATVTASITVEREGPDAGCAGTGGFSLYVGSAVVASQGVTPPSIPVGTVRTLTVTAQVPAADLAAGAVAVVGQLETYHRSVVACPGGTGPGGARIGGWTVNAFTLDVEFGQGDCATQVFANVVSDCETGDVISVTYTDLQGNPYTPTGDIGQCVPASPGTVPCGKQVLERCGCDDTDGDGLGDVRFVELWSFDPCSDATPVLHGAYLDGDFSQPYEPVNPVPCNLEESPGEESPGEVGCGRQIVERCHCDDADGDGTPEVQYTEVWSLDPCSSAPPLLRGTYRDGDFEQPYTPVNPMDCPASDGEPGTQSDSELVLLCDDNGPFLRRFTFTATSVAVVDTLLDGSTSYNPVGTVTVCGLADESPGEVSPAEPGVQVAPVELCDTQDDGTVVRFLRHFRYDDLGVLDGFTDTLADGTDYEPTGDVGSCGCGGCSECGVDQADIGGTIAPASPPAPYEPGTGTATDVANLAPYMGNPGTGKSINGQIGVERHPAGGQVLWDGGAITVGPDAGPGPGAILPEHYRAVAAVLQHDRPSCDDETVTVSVSVRVTNNGPTAALGSPGTFKLANADTGVPYAPQVPITPNAPVGHVQVLTGTWIVPAADLMDSKIACLLYAESWQEGNAKSWTFDQFVATFSYGTVGCPTPPQPSQRMSLCGPSVRTTPMTDVEPIQLCDVNPTTGVSTPFVRHYRYGANGVVVGFRDTRLDGSAYSPVNPPSVCTGGGGTTPPTPVTIHTGGRNLAASATLDVAAEGPGLQSVTVMVAAGTATVTTADGAVTLPAGASATWSVARDHDGELDVLQVATDAAGAAAVIWTNEG